MGEYYSRNARRRRSRLRRWRRARRGVASVVGTLLSLLVFLSLFGIFLEQYLPLWMTDNEAQFTAKTQTAFADLKSNVDLQTVLAGPPVLATPFTMSSDGVPVLAQPTAGILNFVPRTSGVFANITMNPGPGNSARFYQNFSLGTLTMSLPNRYYSPQAFSFEDDAVIQSQSTTQQLVMYAPALSLNVTGSQVAVTMELLQLLGNATQTVSTGAQEVYSHYFFTQTFQSNASAAGLSATFTLGTHYPCAWTAFLVQQFAAAGMGGHATITPAVCTPTSGTANVAVSYTGLTSFTLHVAEISLVVGVGVE